MRSSVSRWEPSPARGRDACRCTSHLRRRCRTPAVDRSVASASAPIPASSYGLYLVAVAAVRDEAERRWPAGIRKLAQYQSTTSPAFSSTLSAPTGGETPFTLNTQPLGPPPDSGRSGRRRGRTTSADVVENSPARLAASSASSGSALTSSAGSVEPKIVWVLPSTRTCTRAARGGGNGRARQAEGREDEEGALEHESSSARGSGWRRAAGLLTRGSLPRRLPSPWASGVSARRASPLTAAGSSRIRTEFPVRYAVVWAESSIGA